MEAIGGVVAITQGAELALSTGKKVLRLIQVYKQSAGLLKELILRVEGIWLKTETQIDFILDVLSANNQLQEERLLRFQHECLETLSNKLQAVLRKLGKFTDADLASGIDPRRTHSPPKRLSKAGYAFVDKHLRLLVAELESWHAIFDPSWYLIIRCLRPEVDRALSTVKLREPKHLQGPVTTAQEIRALQVSSDVIKEAESTGISQLPKLSVLPTDYVSNARKLSDGSSLELAEVTNTHEIVILDTTAYHENVDSKLILPTLRKITQILSISDPFSLGFLKCIGFVPLRDNQFQYVLSLPKQSSPRTLRDLLVQDRPSLDARFRIARSLTKAVSSLHAANFVHKNIRPDTVVIWEDEYGEMSQPYLVGFDQLRPDGGHSALVADMVWHHNLYRHPLRQGQRPQEYYVMQHDIYSLGVCLLEIGVWTSFVTMLDNRKTPGPGLEILDESSIMTSKQAALQVKQTLIDKAKAKLPSQMGRAYTDVVLSCLTCLDEGSNSMFESEDDIYDENGILIGVVFIEKILQRLEHIIL